MTPRTALALVALLCVLSAAPDQAVAQTGWEANVHAATLVNDLFEESGDGVQVGGRLVYTTPWRVTVGGNFDWARLTDVGLGLVDGATADLLLYSGQVGYAVPVASRADLMLAAGIGGVTIRLRDVPSSTGVLTSSSGQLVPVGVGIRLRNRAVDASWAFRADVRDDIIFLDVQDPASGDVDQEPRHNWEISAGVSFLFGGGEPTPTPTDTRPVERRPVEPRPEPEADRPAQPRPVVQGDADRDGVPDRLDRCVRTPSDLAVGATGCPIDMDRDGAPDRRVAQVPPDRPPADEGPEPPEPSDEVEPPRVGPGDTDRDGVADAADRCVNTPIGSAVDERGCPPPPPAAEPVPEVEAPAVEDEARPADEPPVDERPLDEAPPDEAPDEGVEAAPPTACLDGRPWDRPGVTIAFDGRLWEQLGPPEPITLSNLNRVGEFDGVPIYVGSVAEEPYTDLWVPRCSGAYQLYVEEGSAE